MVDFQKGERRVHIISHIHPSLRSSRSSLTGNRSPV
jgi:hypothetical protein